MDLPSQIVPAVMRCSTSDLVNQAERMSCSSGSRFALSCVSPVATNTEHFWSSVLGIVSRVPRGCNVVALSPVSSRSSRTAAALASGSSRSVLPDGNSQRRPATG